MPLPARRLLPRQRPGAAGLHARRRDGLRRRRRERQRRPARRCSRPARRCSRRRRTPAPPASAVGVALRGRGASKAAQRTVKLKARTQRRHRLGPRHAHLPAARMAELRLRPPQPPRHAGREDAVARQRRADRADVDVRLVGLRGRRQRQRHVDADACANGMVFVTAWNGKVYGLRAARREGALDYDTGAGPASACRARPTRDPRGTPAGRRQHRHGALPGGEDRRAALDGQRRRHRSRPRRTSGARRWWPTAASSSAARRTATCPARRATSMPSTSRPAPSCGATRRCPIASAATTRASPAPADADCGGADCVPGVGGGVTATVAVDPTGETVYMGSVGCYTLAVDRQLGRALLARRRHRRGALDLPHAIRSSSTSDAAPFYHDFGFLNGPLLVDASDGAGGTRRLVVGPSKDGTIYAVDPATRRAGVERVARHQRRLRGLRAVQRRRRRGRTTRSTPRSTRPSCPSWPEMQRPPLRVPRRSTARRDGRPRSGRAGAPPAVAERPALRRHQRRRPSTTSMTPPAARG